MNHLPTSPSRGRARPLRGRDVPAATILLALGGLVSLAPPARGEEVGAPPTLAGGVPIHVVEPSGHARAGEPVTFGVPLGEDDDVRDPAGLRVLAPNGKAVPAQFRVLQRWRGPPGQKDLPARWLLVDFQADVAANGQATYVLQRKAAAKSAKGQKLKFKKKGKGKKRRLVVKTGTARFILGLGDGPLFRGAWADFDGDGHLHKSKERFLAAGRDLDFELEDRLGGRYAAAHAPRTVTIEEKGPLRLVVRVDGRHDPLPGAATIGRDFFTYRTRYTFHAGKPWVRVQHSLRNSYLGQPLGSIGFESYDLVLPLATGGAAGAQCVLQDGSTLGGAGALRLYQDTDGGAAWNQAPNASFQGFRVYDDDAAVLHQGAQAPGAFTAGDGDRGLSVVVRDFFENFPKGFAFDGGDELRVQLFPGDFASFHWLDDGQQKTTELLLCPTTAGAAAPADLLPSVQRPLRPVADPAWTRATRAWADHGDLDDPPQPDATLLAFDQVLLDQLYTKAYQRNGYTFGWSEFGEPTWAKSTHTTGSPRNKLSYFDHFLINGSLAWFRTNELFVHHSRDIRTYHVDGFSREAHPQAVLWEALPPWPMSPDKLGRDSLDPALAPHRAGIPTNGHGWNAFDFEHMSVDDLFEYYLLTGDPVSRDSLIEIGEFLRTFPIYSTAKAPGSTRGSGWTMRALLRVWQVSGDQRFLDSLDELVAAVASSYGTQPSPETGLVYHWVTRYPPLATHIATAEYDMPWQLAVVIHGLLAHHRETGDAESLQVATDIADYLVEFGWNGVAMHEALANDDHSIVNPKYENTGVNMWIPSALAALYRYEPKADYFGIGVTMYTSIGTLANWNSSSGYSSYHWFHSIRALMLGD